MTRGQVVVLLLFLAVVGVGAAVLGPRLARRPPTERAPTPAPREEPAPSPPPVDDLLTLVVVGPDGPIAPDRLRFVGADLVGQADDGAVRVRPMRGPGWAGAQGLAWARVPPTARPGVLERVVLLPAAAPLVVRILEADGSPAAGALVGAGPWGPDAGTLRTGADGTARLEGRPPGVATLRVGGTERAGPLLRVLLGSTTEVTATLDPARVVTGRVRDESGAPVPGASVRGLSPDGVEGSETSTDAEGSFRWTGPMTPSLALLVRAAGFADASVEPPWPDPRRGLASEVDVVLQPATAPIEGRLRAPAGTNVELTVEPAVADVLRELYGPASVIGNPRAVDVLDGGRFSVGGLAPGVPVRLRVRGAVAPEDHVLVPGSGRPLDLVPQPTPASAPEPEGPSVLEGRVTDPEGRPLPSVAVVAEGRTATTDRDGRFRLTGLDAGPRRVEARYGWIDGARGEGVDPSAFVAGSSALVRLGEEPVSLVLPRPAGLSFRLLDGIDDRPLAWAHVVVVDGDGGVRFDGVVTTRDGRATLEGLEPGAAGVLSAFAPGRRREGAVTLVAGKVTDLGDLDLAPGGRVSGEVRARDNAPIVDAVVSEVEDAWVKQAAGDLARQRDRLYRRARTKEDGTFVLDGLDASRPVALAVWAPGHAPVPRRVVWSSEAATVKAVLSTAATLRLRLTDPKGAPVSGAVIDLEDAHTGIHLLDVWRRGIFGSVVGSTDDLRRASESYLFEDPTRPGSYRVGPVEPGPYEAWVERPGYRPLRRRLTVPDARSTLAELEIHLPLEPEPAPEGGPR